MDLTSSPSLTDWISAVSTALSALFLLFGLFIASRQLNGWKAQVKLQRKVDVADGILAAANEIEDLMKNVRSSLESVPAESIGDKSYIYREKDRRLRERGGAFQSLRSAQIRAKYLFQDARIDSAIEELFQARINFWNSLDFLVDHAGSPPTTVDERELVKNARSVVVARNNDQDPVFVSIRDSLRKLELFLGPTMRLNE